MPAEVYTHSSGLSAVRVSNASATAHIMLLGAHLFSYTPNGGDDLLWMSERSFFQEGKAIRGGVPICWPWFGPHPTDATKPSHGFVRTLIWNYAGVKELDANTTVCTFTLQDTPETHQLWDHSFELTMEFTIGATLSMALTTRNTDTAPLPLTQAFHTYFAIQDITQVQILGLEKLDYTDKVGGAMAQCTMPDAPLTFDKEVDRVFYPANGPYKILDKVSGRIITIQNSGSNSAVAWNPWIAKSLKMSADFPPEGYKNMVCVETTNAGQDARTIQPGNSHTLKTTYSF